MVRGHRTTPAVLGVGCGFDARATLLLRLRVAVRLPRLEAHPRARKSERVRPHAGAGPLRRAARCPRHEGPRRGAGEAPLHVQGRVPEGPPPRTVTPPPAAEPSVQPAARPPRRVAAHGRGGPYAA